MVRCQSVTLKNPSSSFDVFINIETFNNVVKNALFSMQPQHYEPEDFLIRLWFTFWTLHYYSVNFCVAFCLIPLNFIWSTKTGLSFFEISI